MISDVFEHYISNIEFDKDRVMLEYDSSYMNLNNFFYVLGIYE